MTRPALRMAFAVLLLSLALPFSSVAADDSFGGVGLQVVPTVKGELVVLNVLDGAPAARQGLLPGDLIFRVDDFALEGSDFGKVVSEYLWGPVGSTVEVHYRRPGVSGENRVVLQRAAINPRMTVTPTVQSGTKEQEESR